MPLKGGYSELKFGSNKKNRMDELEMQILKTETFEVISRPKQDLPEDLIPGRGSSNIQVPWEAHIPEA